MRGAAIARWVLTACVVLTGAASADAATTVGQTFAPSTSCTTTSASPTTFLQSTSSAPSYTVPSAGVITSWSHQSAATAHPSLRLKVARLISSNTFQTIGESAIQAPVANTLNVFATRIPVAAGDIIGATYVGAGSLCFLGNAGFGHHTASGDPPIGQMIPYSAFSNSGIKIDVSALVEPDADGDGYGDDSQDGCPRDATRQAPPCPETTVPDTGLTTSPKGVVRAKKRTAKARFEFIATVAGSAFECRLDSPTFDPCRSPFEQKVGVGRHTFAVRAVGPSGLTDATPSTYTWKVKRKKKR